MKKIIILLIIISLFINGCCKVKYYIIPEKERFQMNLGDTIIYKSQAGISDTLIINYRNDEIIPDNINTTDDCSDNDWHEELTFNYILLKNNEETGHLYIGQTVINKKLDFFINYGKITGAVHVFTKHKQLTLNNTEYENVLEFDFNNHFIKVFLNTQKGVLAYQYATGETFYLDKYIKSNL